MVLKLISTVCCLIILISSSFLSFGPRKCCHQVNKEVTTPGMIHVIHISTMPKSSSSFKQVQKIIKQASWTRLLFIFTASTSIVGFKISEIFSGRMALSCERLCDTWNYLTVFVTCLYLNKAILSAYNREECDVFKDAAVSQNLSAYSHNRWISMSGQHQCAH